MPAAAFNSSTKMTVTQIQSYANGIKIYGNVKSSLMRLPTVSEAHPAAWAHFPSGWPHASWHSAAIISKTDYVLLFETAAREKQKERLRSPKPANGRKGSDVYARGTKAAQASEWMNTKKHLFQLKSFIHVRLRGDGGGTAIWEGSVWFLDGLKVHIALFKKNNNKNKINNIYKWRCMYIYIYIFNIILLFGNEWELWRSPHSLC